ncbi:MAG: hypothetical protein ACRECP_02080 [Methylocella sp.]
MEIASLRYLLMVAEVGSFAKAATHAVAGRFISFMRDQARSRVALGV